MQSFPGDEKGDDLGVVGGLEDGALLLGVPLRRATALDNVAIVDDGQVPLTYLVASGWAFSGVFPGGGVAHMAGWRSSAHGGEPLFVEHLRYKAVSL